MQYITTRNNNSTFSFRDTLLSSCAVDGGLYVPQHLPAFNRSDILSLKDRSFGQNVADILNAFFETALTEWDVNFCIGRDTARIVCIGNKVLLAQLWHNPSADFKDMLSGLWHCVCDGEHQAEITEWFSVAGGIAVLFALYGDLLQQNMLSDNTVIDISLSTKDMTMPAAAFYARMMGLPIGSILLTSDQSSALWDMVHRGSASFNGLPATLTNGAERILHATLGDTSVAAFADALQKHRMYFVDEEQLPVLSKGLFCAVTSAARIKQTINSFYRSNDYLLGPLESMCVGGLQDYRSRTGEHKQTVILSPCSPVRSIQNIAEATGLPLSTVTQLINHQ